MMQCKTEFKKFHVTVEIPNRGFGNNRGSKEVYAKTKGYGVLNSENNHRIAICNSQAAALNISRLMSDPKELEIRQHFECHAILNCANMNLNKDAWGDYFRSGNHQCVQYVRGRLHGPLQGRNFMITKKVTYEFDGVSYSSFDRAVDAVEDKIFKEVEAALRDTDIRHAHKQKVMQYILDNKAEFVRLLSIDTTNPEIYGND